MKLREIFAKPVDRNIEGVIKADDLDSLMLEIEEYVFTNEISKRLSVFFDSYNNFHGANGVWISGFFGSGKSHLLKMLAFLLDNREIDGKPAVEYFLPKCGEDAMLQAEMRKAVSIPSNSILFNIDQKADTISKTETDALLSVFVKVFNEMLGYYGKHGYIAQFERDLDERDLLDEFKSVYREVSGQPWETGREQTILEKENIAEAYGQVSGTSREAHMDLMDNYRADYKVSIEDFAEMVNDYIQKQEPGFRLNFFVDEVGQYIAGNVKLMTNLQTIAESLATKCQGRSWIIVTAQEEMKTVLGEMGKQQSNDFTKIQDRFQTRMKLTSANVDEVIQKRLLKKNAEGGYYLEPVYKEEKNNFGTLFDFSDGSMTYRNFRDQAHFIRSYPFIPYQFTLFQSTIENLSLHNAFEGRHSSVGERSMLGVFQQVVLEIADQDIGVLATFDLMFEGIRTVLKTQIQRSILNAEEHLQDKFAVQVLKALFLVKYVKEFKATPRNIRVLMLEHFDQDLPGLRDRVEQALTVLEQQTYVQRSGEVYEYLTDEEKDIEQEIKNTDVETGDVARTLEDILFTDILRDRKIRYEVTDQDFNFTKRLDDRLIGREQELSIHFITPFHEHVDNLSILKANSLGKSELMVVLPPDERLVGDLLMYKKTEKYIRLNHSTTQRETVRRILGDKSFQNKERFDEIQIRARQLVSKAKIIVSGEQVEIGGEDPRTRIMQGFQELIVRSYPNLRMLRGVSYTEDDISKYLDMTQGTLFGGEEASFTEAEQEMLAFIQGNDRNGIRTTMKGLEDKFSLKPYGWYLAAIQCILAKLCGRGKVEVRSDGNLLEGQDLERALKNTHGFPNVILTPQIEFTARQIKWLKDFYSDFFDRPAGTTEARQLGKQTGQAFIELLEELENLTHRADRYPFLNTLDEPIDLLQEFVGKPYSFFLTELDRYEDRLFDLKEEVLDPVRRFMRGPNREIYDQARRLLHDQEPNFQIVAGQGLERLQAILNNPDCYRGGQMLEAKELMEVLSGKIQEALEDERREALDKVTRLQESMKAMEDYACLAEDKREELERPFNELYRSVKHQKYVAVIRESLRSFEDRKYSQLLNQVTCDEDGKVGGQVEYILLRELRIPFSKPFLADEGDAQEYLDRLKSRLIEEIQSGKRIQV